MRKSIPGLHVVSRAGQQSALLETHPLATSEYKSRTLIYLKVYEIS